MARPLTRLLTLLAAILIVLVSGTSIAFAGTKPPAPYPPELKNADTIGINKQTGEYCDMFAADEKTRLNCRAPADCEDYPAGMVVCLGEGSHDSDEAHQFELKELKRWEAKADKNAPNYANVHKYLEKCVKEDKKTFQECNQEASAKYPLPSSHFRDWVAGQISEMAANALEEAASMLGHSVVWLLKEFADAFNEVSTIDLAKTGIGPVLGITTGLSLVVACFLLLMQFAKVAVSQQGGPMATAVVGLAKWGAILAVYLFATQVALNWSDTLSTALINYTFDGGGSSAGDASKAMEKQLGTLFAGLVGTGGAATAGAALITGSGIAPTAVGFVVVISILCILAIGALWIEMLVRQAGIMILITMMPLALAGQMSDGTKDWWPKARNALIALILMKPTIVIVFSIGFSAMSGAEGVRNVIVGLIIFMVAAISWPVLAKFIVMTSTGEGTSTASGLISSVGSSVSSMFGGNQPGLSGAGTSGGGSNYTKALEGENASASESGGGGFWSKTMMGSKGASFTAKAGGAIGVGLQVAAMGKDVAESSFQNSAAHAGLGSGSQGGRHVVIPPRSSPDSRAPVGQSAAQEAEPPTSSRDAAPKPTPSASSEGS
ncbi:hypothetical protein ACWCQM_36675 [Streptomyces sp. NPDC002125]